LVDRLMEHINELNGWRGILCKPIDKRL